MENVAAWGKKILNDKDSGENFASMKFEGLDLPSITDSILKEGGLPAGRRLALIRALHGLDFFSHFSHVNKNKIKKRLFSLPKSAPRVQKGGQTNENKRRRILLPFYH